jgi:hypothetical protein
MTIHENESRFHLWDITLLLRRKKMKHYLLSVVLAALTFSVAWAQASEPVLDIDEKELIRYEEGHGLHVGDKVSFFGYGELHYNRCLGTGSCFQNSQDQFDFHRFVIGMGVDFTDWLVFRSEVDFEHAATELELEYAYLDFLIDDAINVRVGSILVPVGFLNEHHEPPLFNSVERPLYNKIVIPTSWVAAGVGVHGKTAFGLEYQAYLMESLDADGFSGSSGIRGGRNKAAAAIGTDIAALARLDYKGVAGLSVGASAWVGNTAQQKFAGGGLTSVLTGDIRYEIEGIEMIATGAWIHVGDAATINSTHSTDVGSQILGGYGEIAYHLFHHMMPSTKHDLVAFVRHERINTHHKIPTGTAKAAANNKNVTTFGVSYLPIPQVALKADFSLNRNKANTDANEFNLGMAYMF